MEVRTCCSLLPCCYGKEKQKQKQAKSNFRGKGFLGLITSRSRSIPEGSRVRAEGGNGSGRHRRTLLPLACSAAFLTQPRPTYPKAGQPTVLWALPHQSAIKIKCPTDMLPGLADAGNSSNGLPSSGICHALSKRLQAAKGLDNPTSLPPLPHTAWIAGSDWLHLALVAILDGHPLVLGSPICWGLHCTRGYTFTGLSSGTPSTPREVKPWLPSRASSILGDSIIPKATPSPTAACSWLLTAARYNPLNLKLYAARTS